MERDHYRRIFRTTYFVGEYRAVNSYGRNHCSGLYDDVGVGGKDQSSAVSSGSDVGNRG